MAEEAILSEIEEIDNWLLNHATPEKHYDESIMQEIKDQLMLIHDFINDSTDGRKKLLNYFIADFVDIVHDALREITPKVFPFTTMKEAQSRLRKLFPRIIKLVREEGEEGEGAEGPLRSPDVGDRGGENVVGLEETIESLLCQEILPGENWAHSNGPHTCVIEGVGGIGKTILARELYNHADVAAHFQCRAWVCFPSVKSNKQVLMELIVRVGEGLGFESLEEMDNRSLQQTLRQQLHNKRYFIVLDGVDEDTRLVSVLKALPNDAESRVLLTTQSRQIRGIHNCQYHNMKFLDDDKSWELFLKIVFSGSNSYYQFPKKLERRGRKMLKQCGGLPLAIIEMGRQIAIKRQSGIEWEEILDSPIDFTETLAALELTYNKFPPKAKSIFLCLSFFEEGTMIRLQKLLQIGIAQRVINSETEGEVALSVLKRHSFVEMVDSAKLHRPKYLQIKTIFHRLSVKRAEEDIKFEILRNNGNSPSSRITFHRVIYCSREKFNYSMNQEKHLESLFFRGAGYFDASQSYWKRFYFLAVLDMEGFGLKLVPDGIRMLTRLKYLGLRNNHIQNLLVWLRCLKNLEVLDIALNFIVEVPDIIWEMGSLRHLYMSNIICLRPLKMDILKNIETLTYISVENWTYEVSMLPPMNKLRKLGIDELDGTPDVSKLFASLARLMSICNLTLKGSRFKNMPLLDGIGVLRRITTLKLDGLLTRLPSAKDFPPNIRYLTLVNSSLDEDPMPILEKLSSLNFLKLQNAYTGKQMVISHNGFMGLNVLCIKELWHLRNVQVTKMEKWSLYLLEINDCPYLETIPKVESKQEGFKIVTNHKNRNKMVKM